MADFGIVEDVAECCGKSAEDLYTGSRTATSGSALRKANAVVQLVKRAAQRFRIAFAGVVGGVGEPRGTTRTTGRMMYS